MMDAQEIRKQYNLKTPYEKVMEDIRLCIEQAAKRGEREIKYRFPCAYGTHALYQQVMLDLETLYHYKVFDGNSGTLWDDDTLYISW